MTYPRDKSAFIHRNCGFCCYLQARWRNEAEMRLAEQYLKEWCDLMNAFWDGRTYQNFPDEDYPDYRQNYWGSSFPALLCVKKKYDPMGMFAFPQMIKAQEQNTEDVSVNSPRLVAEALGQIIAVNEDSD